MKQDELDYVADLAFQLRDKTDHLRTLALQYGTPAHSMLLDIAFRQVDAVEDLLLQIQKELGQ